MSPSLLRSTVILGLLAALGPASIDMYLPALPSIAEDLGSPVGAVQMTLAAYFLGFGVSQLVYGPIADQVGRKPPLYAGLAIFAIASIVCALAPTVEVLLAARVAQGIGGGAAMVVPRAIVRDQYTGVEATRLMGLMMMVVSVSPMIAPLAGSGVMLLGGWQGIFFALGAGALLGLLMIGFLYPETLDENDRVPFNKKTFLGGTRLLLTDGPFMIPTLICGFCMASFFVFVASASFVYTGQFGLSPTGFGLAFALNGVGFFFATQAAAGIGARLGMARMVTLAILGFVLLMLTLLTVIALGFGTLPMLIGFLFLGNACLGLVIPTTMVLALERHGEIAGLASSLGGTLQMMVVGGMIALASPFFDGTATPMIASILACGLFALVLTRLNATQDPVHQPG
ncbi:MAG: multidrug effflux MFS transporter [Pseudomonadota bacterium]